MGNIKDDIKNILEYAVNAPSGNNSQPWRFKVKDNKIFVYNIPKRDSTPYNFEEKGSYFAHGALIENIIIVSSKYQYKADLKLFPDLNQPDCSALITLEKGSEPDALFDYILDRATNRRHYKKISLPPAHKEEILKTVQEIIGGEIKLIEDKIKMEPLSFAIAAHEKLIFENKMIHNIVFSSITWSKKETEKKRLGLYIKTKFPDTPSFLLPIMKSFRRWPFVKFLNKIGFSKKIHKQSIQSCLAVSALGAILIAADSKENFFMAGRLFQRIWLKATKLKLSIQPMTGIPYLARRILAGNADSFSKEQENLIKNSNKTIHNMFNAEDKVIAMIFRMGYDDKLPIKTLKLPPEIIFMD